VTFDNFVAARLGALVRYAAVLVGDRHLAQDIVQDVLVRAHSRWARITAMDQPEAFVRRMIVTEFLSWRRRLVRRSRLAAASGAHAPTDVVADHAHASVERVDVLSRLATLPRRQRTVVVLRYYDGRSTAEIADLLGCSEGAVRTYHSRAMSTLRLTFDRNNDLETIP
jgi:RNA polymerase sigma-70 factor (sigma-E family)